jgi:branched-chain amino acid transport system substrate-binding protein
VAAAIRGGCFNTKQTPGILLDVCFDDKGDLDRESFMVEVKNGHQVVTATLPPLNAKK